MLRPIVPQLDVTLIIRVVFRYQLHTLRPSGALRIQPIERNDITKNGRRLETDRTMSLVLLSLEMVRSLWEAPP